MPSNESILVQKPFSNSASFDLSIREMQIDDLDRVSELEKQMFSNIHSKKIMYEILENSLSFAYVVEKDYSIVGYEIYWRVDTDAHLTDFAVDKKYPQKTDWYFIA